MCLIRILKWQRQDCSKSTSIYRMQVIKNSFLVAYRHYEAIIWLLEKRKEPQCHIQTWSDACYSSQTQCLLYIASYLRYIKNVYAAQSCAMSSRVSTDAKSGSILRESSCTTQSWSCFGSSARVCHHLVNVATQSCWMFDDSSDRIGIKYHCFAGFTLPGKGELLADPASCK